ncbi:hypothetical protein WJX74_006929 [Apatococcus lobatus]|uniref:Ribosome-binding factor A n=1 Tax=Apatococcus lobatus TaxID=904363 RepID=A0AAW1SB96_9CHLO
MFGQQAHNRPALAQSRCRPSCPDGLPHTVHPLRLRHGTHRNHSSVTCMAHPRRMAKVSKQIEREIGSLFLSDEKMQRAVHPGRSPQQDDILPPITSVTEVRVSGDLSVAKVYVSVYGDEEEQAATLEKLYRLQGYVRKHIGSAMSLRMTPEIRFLRDEFIQRGEQVLAALDQIQLQREGKIGAPPIAISRNVRAAVDRAHQQEEADTSNSFVYSNGSALQGEGDDDDDDDALDIMLEDEDSDADDSESAGINLDEYFARERQMAAAQQQQKPARARRR